MPLPRHWPLLLYLLDQRSSTYFADAVVLTLARSSSALSFPDFTRHFFSLLAETVDSVTRAILIHYTQSRKLCCFSRLFSPWYLFLSIIIPFATLEFCVFTYFADVPMHKNESHNRVYRKRRLSRLNRVSHLSLL